MTAEAGASDLANDAPRRPPPPRWVLPTALVPMLGVLAMGWVAGAVWPTWFRTHPLGLILLSPINRFLLLTTNHLDFWSYFGAGLGRHLFPDPFFFLLGHYYGARALKWVSDGTPAARRIVGDHGEGLEDPAHRKILYPLAFFMPNNWVSLICGAARFPVPVFVTLNVSGTIARLILCRWLGSVFESEIKSIADFIGDYQWAITAVSVVVVLIGMAVQLRPGGPISRLAHLDESPDFD